MTYTTFRNPCTETSAGVVVLASFAEARAFAAKYPNRMEMEVEADTIDEAAEYAWIEYNDARDYYLASMHGDIY